MCSGTAKWTRDVSALRWRFCHFCGSPNYPVFVKNFLITCNTYDFNIIERVYIHVIFMILTSSNVQNRCHRVEGVIKQYTSIYSKALMCSFEEHVKHEWCRVVILLTFNLKALETLHYITKTGEHILHCS